MVDLAVSSPHGSPLIRGGNRGYHPSIPCVGVMSNPTSSWEKIGDQFYRKLKLYDAIFDQDLELENYLIAGAPYAGAIALYRDEAKLRSFGGSKSAKAGIDIYSCSGKLIRHIVWDKGSIRGLGWSEDEKLLIVSSDGAVRCYYDLQGDFAQFSLGNGTEDHEVVGCRFWSHGFVAILDNNHLIAVSNYTEPRPKLLALPPSDVVHAWAVIPPAFTLSRSVEVLLAVDQTIYVVDASDAEDRVLPSGPFRHVSLSPNGLYVALYTENGMVWVITVDFQNKVGEYESRTKITPKDVQWCGNDSVLLAWEDEVQMIAPNGAVSKYYYDGWVHLLPDIDGVRLITNDVCELLQKVPDTTEAIFRLGSTAPASVLLDAIDQLDQKSPKADENVQLIRPNLPDAIATCVRAAGQEYDVHYQKKLLRAASFGKSVLDLYSSDDFVDMCEDLRVLNAVRDYRIGLPLSYAQFEHLGSGPLIKRLVNRCEYLLAVRLSTYLHLPVNGIYTHWAVQKARNSVAEEAIICKDIVAKLISKRGISFELIARTAYDEGRSNLATDLLNHESRAGKQVPLLLSMSKDEIALDKAIASGDTDLVFFVLLHLKKTLPLASFFRLLNNRFLATALVESSAKAHDKNLLKDLLHQDDRRLDGANLLFSEALAQTAPQTKIDKLKLANKLLADSTKDPAASGTHNAIQEAQALIRLQTGLDSDMHNGDKVFTGLSLIETLHRLILTAQFKRAQKAASDFHISDKSFAWVRLRALVAKRDWVELEDIATKNKRSSIGWEPYFTEILAAGNTKLAGNTFVTRCTGLSARERADMWTKCEMVSRAGEELVKAKDVDGLESIKAKLGSDSTGDIDRLIAQLRLRK